jgi:hypothetical protein
VIDAWTGPTPTPQQFPHNEPDGIRKLLDKIRAVELQIKGSTSNFLGPAIQDVVKHRKNAGIVEGSTELLPEFTPLETPPDLLNSPQEFTPPTDPPKHPDLSTKHLNSRARVQESSPPLGTTELLGSSSHTAPESSPVQADRKCNYCHTEPEPPGGGICSTCTDLIKAAS